MSWFYISNYYIFSAFIFSHNILLMWHLNQFLCMNSVSVQSILYQAATLIICHYKKIMLSYQYIPLLKKILLLSKCSKNKCQTWYYSPGMKVWLSLCKISVISFQIWVIFFLNTSFLMITCLSHLILLRDRKEELASV